MQAFHYDTIDSTNEEAKRLLARGAIRDVAFLVAREQTNGRGSRGRAWSSPRDAGVYLTIVEAPPAERSAGMPRGGPHTVTLFTLAAGVGCVDAILRATGVAARLKPVNDLYVEGRKLGGILTETTVQGSVVTALITGIGINLQPVEHAAMAGSIAPASLGEHLSREAAARLDVNALIAALVHEVRRWQEFVWTGAGDRILRAWNERKVDGSSLPIHEGEPPPREDGRE